MKLRLIALFSICSFYFTELDETNMQCLSGLFCQGYMLLDLTRYFAEGKRQNTGVSPLRHAMKLRGSGRDDVG
ncbi:hypothetical protein [Edaphobacter dinghuensis]|uniref:hypothetical protein n=1 Tax=Edaphobacter dinghuensis TaxID=1560005 RepID=UPI00166C7608|nr:hypothetical protein [Edaphobacter dinghuensis]